MPVKRLYGWTPASWTIPAYAPAVWWKPWTWRVIVREDHFAEPELTPEDVAWLHASVAADAETDANGHPLAESMSPLADPSNRASQWRYTTGGKPSVNWATRALELDQKEYYERYPNADRAGDVWTVYKEPI